MNGPKADEKSLYRLPEVARRLSLKIPTVRKLIFKGQLPAVKIGGAVAVRHEALEAFVDNLPPRAPGVEPKEATRSSLVRRKRRV